MTYTPRKIARESWSYIWNHQKKEVVRAFCSLLRERPLALFLLSLGLSQFSFIGILGAILGFAISQFILEIFLQIETIGTRRKVIEGFIISHEESVPGFQLKRHSLKKYITEIDKYEDINTYTISKFSGLLGINSITLDNSVHVYSIQVKGTKKLLENVTCFAVPFSGSHIFFNCEPEDVGWFQKFTLLHELAHIMSKVSTADAFSKYGFQIYLIFFIAIYSFISFESIPSMWLIFLIMIFLVGFVEGFYVKKNIPIWSEVVSDSFALMYLDKKDIDEFVKYQSLIGSFIDLSMDSQSNKIRFDHLKKNLTLIKAGKIDQMLEETYSIIFKPSFFRLLLGCFAIILLSFYANPISLQFLIGLTIVSILTFLFFLFLLRRQLRLTQEIDNWLKERIIDNSFSTSKEVDEVSVS